MRCACVPIGERLDVTVAVPHEAGPVQLIGVPGPPADVTDRHCGLGRLGCRHRLDRGRRRHTVDCTAQRTVPGLRGHPAIPPRTLKAVAPFLDVPGLLQPPARLVQRGTAHAGLRTRHLNVARQHPAGGVPVSARPHVRQQPRARPFKRRARTPSTSTRPSFHHVSSMILQCCSLRDRMRRVYPPPPCAHENTLQRQALATT